MLLEIQKTEMIEITLEKVLYVCFADRRYYRFTPIDNGDNIEVLQFAEMDNNFDLQCRKGLFDSMIPIINLKHEYAKEITEDEFNIKLQDLLLHYI
jgi:hypothetical protein